jgi:Zn-finger nucleic acid-binding protein
MKCPQDDTTLAMSDRQGIEIDYCPTCRGVWLDRGELDKLIERESRWVEERDDERDAERTPKRADVKPEPPKKKKKVTSFLQDIMEMGQQ